MSELIQARDVNHSDALFRSLRDPRELARMLEDAGEELFVCSTETRMMRHGAWTWITTAAAIDGEFGMSGEARVWVRRGS